MQSIFVLLCLLAVNWPQAASRTLVLGALNGTSERQLVQLHPHTGKAKTIASVTDQTSYHYDGKCLLAADAKNDIAFLFNQTHALSMALSDGRMAAAYRRGGDDYESSYQVMFWNKSDTYSLQAIHTYQPPQQNFTQTCWARLVAAPENKTMSAQCMGQLPYNLQYTRACVFQQEEAAERLWYTSAAVGSSELEVLVAVKLSELSTSQPIAWAGWTGITDVSSFTARDCYARDSELNKTFGITPVSNSSLSQQLVEIVAAPLPLPESSKLPAPKHLLSLPAGLALQSRGACTYNVSQHQFQLVMRGDLGSRDAVASRIPERQVAESPFTQWLLTVNTKTPSVQITPLTSLPDNFVALQMLTIS